MPISYLSFTNIACINYLSTFYILMSGDGASGSDNSTSSVSGASGSANSTCSGGGEGGAGGYKLYVHSWS